MKSKVRIPGFLVPLPIHGAAVQSERGALVFLGPSEMGKSTVSRLLEPLPVLADDGLYMMCAADGSWGAAAGDVRAFSGPLSAPEAAALRPVPLRGIFRLFRAEEPRLMRLEALELCRYLTHALFDLCWPLQCSLEAKKRAFADLAGIARAVPGYRLYFDRSPRTVEILSNV